MTQPTTTIELPRIKGESAKAFAARQEYVLMGPQRSLEKTRQKLAKDSPGYTRVLKEWSERFGWVESAAKYDSEISLITVQDASARHIADLEAHRAQANQVGDALIGVGAQLVTQVSAAIKNPKKIKGEDGKWYTLHGIELTAQTFAIAARALQTGLDLKAHALGVDSVLGANDSE
jgi:hypothetical protein